MDTMKMVDASHVTQEEQVMQQALVSYPELRERLMYLFSGYREQLDMCMEEMYHAHLDTADAYKSMEKRDNALRRIGLLRE